MRPLALAIAASVWDGGPITAIDLPGADPKVKAVTTASQPATTSVIAPAIRPHRQAPCRRPSVIIEVLNARAFGLEFAVDVHETVDPDLQAGPAKAGPGVQLQ